MVVVGRNGLFWGFHQTDNFQPLYTIHNIIEDEIYSVGLRHEKNQLQLFQKKISGFSLEKL